MRILETSGIAICSFGIVAESVVVGAASPTTALSAAIQIPTTLPALVPLQRQHLSFFRMLEASLREFREYYATMVLKCVTNLAMFCARVSRDQRTNPLLCSAEVLFTKSAASIATSCTMDKLTEPWKQG